ncbi:MAG: hypothetical protein AAF503_07455 [Pseudomonadota bacterium]
MMMGVYESYLAQMEQAGFRRDITVSLSKPAKVWRGLRAVLWPGQPAHA